VRGPKWELLKYHNSCRYAKVHPARCPYSHAKNRSPRQAWMLPMHDYYYRSKGEPPTGRPARRYPLPGGCFRGGGVPRKRTFHPT